MAKILDFKKQKTADRIVTRCEFLTEEWERQRMHHMILEAFHWAEQTSDQVDQLAPYAIVRTY